MKYDPAFIEAIKDFVCARSIGDKFHGIECKEDCLHLSYLKKAEAHLDSFGEEKKGMEFEFKQTMPMPDIES